VQAQVAQKVARSGTAEDVSNALNKLIAGVDRAHRLVTQLLSLARLEQRTPAARTATERQIGAVVDSVVHDLETLAERQGVLMQVGAMPDVPVPEEPLYLLIRNLVDNALRHSPRGTAATIECLATSEQLVLNICDQGPGLPEAHRDRVLERFYRGTQSYDGNGLGLSIVSRVVQLLHGRISMRDANGSSGLCVGIVIPLPIRI
jgi:two-component system sensor histidine kinase TctE